MKTTEILSFFIGCLLVLAIMTVYMDRHDKDGYNNGYKIGYKNAKLTYQCDHDNTECEILKEEI